jgi:hypothetical protein
MKHTEEQSPAKSRRDSPVRKRRTKRHLGFLGRQEVKALKIIEGRHSDGQIRRESIRKS